MSKRLICLGDSITEGIGDELGHGWAGRVNASISADKPAEWHVMNLGVAGDTVIDINHRLLSEVAYRHPEFLVIAAGLNDVTTRIWPDSKNTKIDVNYAKDIWRQITSFVKRMGWPCLFIGPYRVNEALLPLRFMPYDDQDLGHNCSNEKVALYNDMLKKEIESADFEYIDMFNLLEKTDYTSQVIDGLHPNAKGYDILADIIYPRLLKKL